MDITSNFIRNKNCVIINFDDLHENNINKELQANCKILEFSSNWNIVVVITEITKLNPRKYKNLFIFVIKTKYYSHVQDKVDELKKCLLNFGLERPLLLQITSENENFTIFFYKDEVKNYMFANYPTFWSDLGQQNIISKFLNAFLNEKFELVEQEIIRNITKIRGSLLLRLLRTINLPNEILEKLILKIARRGNKKQLLAALDTPFDEHLDMLNSEVQHLLSSEFPLRSSKTSILFEAVKKENENVIDFLIKTYVYFIQQLPFDHQVKISTTSFMTDQLDFLCDLLQIADFPFPNSFNADCVKHERLLNIIKERQKLSLAIGSEDINYIIEFIENNHELKVAYDVKNKSALKLAADALKPQVYCFLKRRNFYSINPKEIFEYMIYNETSYHQNYIQLLCNRSVIHNRRLDLNQSREYRKKIRKWFKDIKLVESGRELLKVASLIGNLKIIFDFESDMIDIVENSNITISNDTDSKNSIKNWIFVGAKLSNKHELENIQQEQKIKGVLVRELCRCVIELVFGNDGNPYYEHRHDLREMFHEMVLTFGEWSTHDSKLLGDKEFDGIISSILTQSQSNKFQSKIIVRVIQIFVEFDNDQEKLRYLEDKYRMIFYFWRQFVLPELRNCLLRDDKVINLNNSIDFFKNLEKNQLKLKVRKNLTHIFDNQYTVLITNCPKLLFIDLRMQLYEKFGILMDSINIFINAETIFNPEIQSQIKTFRDQKINIFVDCTKNYSNKLGNFVNSMIQNVIFIVNPANNRKIIQILNKNCTETFEIMEVNYSLNDLTWKSQKLLLKSKIKFQNNTEILLIDLLRTKKKDEASISTFQPRNSDLDYSTIIDTNLLNLLLKNNTIDINSANLEIEKDFDILYTPRVLTKKCMIDLRESLMSTKEFITIEKTEKPLLRVFLRKILKFFRGSVKSEVIPASSTSIDFSQKPSLEKIIKFSEQEFLDELKNKQYILISDHAESGKSWFMKNYAKILHEQNPTNWISYINLEEFTYEFKEQFIQKCTLEFSKLISEKILMLHHEFETKIFQLLYNNGKVIIFFDGFDNIAPDYAEFVLNLIMSFKHNGGNQLWISTRDFFEKDLKQALNLDISYGLDTMTDDEGIELIAKCWMLLDLHSKSEIYSVEHFNEFIKYSLKFERYKQKAAQFILKAKMNSKSFKSLLQMFKIIADAFKDEKTFETNLSVSRIHQILISNLYSRWSLKKYKIRKESPFFLKFHQFHAIASLFPKIVHKLFDFYDVGKWPEEVIIACEILKIQNENVFFLDNSVRDYFVADFIVNKLIKSPVNEVIMELFMEVLCDKKFNRIRMFLNDMIILNETISQKMLRSSYVRNHIEKFCEALNYSNIIEDNLKNLVGFVIDILRNGSYRMIKKCIYNISAKDKTNGTISFIKFQEFAINVLTTKDLKKLITMHEIIKNCINSSLEIDILKDFLRKLRNRIDISYIRQELFRVLNKEDFFTSVNSANFNAGKVKKLFNLVEDFLTSAELFDLMAKNEKEQNVFYYLFENFEIMCIVAKKNVNSFKNLIAPNNGKNKSILHLVAPITNIDIHLNLWKVLLRTFDDLEEFKEFILRKYINDNNFVHELVFSNQNLKVIDWTFEKIKTTLNRTQFNKILSSKGMQRSNLLQLPAFWSREIQVHQMLWSTYKDFYKFNKKYFRILKELNELNQNIIHIAAMYSPCNVFKFIVQELKKSLTQDEIREMLINVDIKNQNILKLALYWNKSSKVHLFLWDTLQSHFTKVEIRNLLKNTDNLLKVAIDNNLMKIVSLAWYKIKDYLNQIEQIEYLKQINLKEDNIDEILLNWIKCEIQKIEDYKSNFKIIWRFKGSQNYCLCELKEGNVLKIYEYFIIDEIKGETFEYSMDTQHVNLKTENIISESGCNFLIFAVKENHHDIIRNLLSYDFDINHEDNQHRNAIDHAWINYKTSIDDLERMKREETMLNLLNANSKLPKKKFKFSFNEAPERIQEFIRKCEDLHERLANDQLNNIEDFWSKSLRYFYDRHNNSLLLRALKLRKEEFIKQFGTFLSIEKNEVYYELTRDPRTEFISKLDIPKPHIMLLKSKSEMYGQSYQYHKSWVYIDNIYKLLDKNEVCSKILRITAENKSLKIIFVPEDNDNDSKEFKSNDMSNVYNGKLVYITANIVMEEEPHSSSTLEDENKVAKIVIEKFCRVAISMLCLDDNNVDEMKESTLKDDKEITDDLELTVQKVFIYFNELLFDHFLSLDIGDLIFNLRTLQNEDEIIRFDNLPDPIQQRIVASKFNFQGVDVDFFSIIDDKFKILTRLTSKSIRDIFLRNTKLKIGENCKINDNFHILDREIVEHKNNTRNQVSSKESKLSILVDDFGSGKTAKLKAMSAKFKQDFKSSWVSLIKLTESSEILQKYRNQDAKIDEDFIIKLLHEIIGLTSNLEAEILRYLFHRSKVILLVDDIDKIDPKLSEFVVKIIVWINQNSSNEMWITTCPVFLEQMCSQVDAKIYKFNLNDSLSYDALILRFFKELKDVDDKFKTPGELTSFINTIERGKRGLLNCGMIRAVVEVYIENEADFKEEAVNFYAIFEKVHQRQQNLFNRYLLNDSNDQFEDFSIPQVHQVHALILILKKVSNIKLYNRAIMKKWSREQKKWPKERIGRHGFISFDKNYFHFIHHSYAEFFLAEYMISYIYSNDYCIKDEEFEKIFEIIRFMTQHFDDFEIVLKFIIGYAKTRADSEYDELHETMRHLIDKNIQQIQNDIVLSRNAENLKQFWSWIAKNDKELSKVFNLN